MQCKYCGQELAEGSAFCHRCGRAQQETAAPSKAEAAAAQPPQTGGDNAIKCPHCGSTRLQFTTTVKTQGFSAGDACCGYALLGPFGLLCGLCGAGSETKESWVCCDCGTRFTTKEAQKAVQQKLQHEQNLVKKQQEREAQLATWRALMESCPYPTNQLDTLYDQAVKEDEEKSKIFSDQCAEERKRIGVWQAAIYGIGVGLLILLIGVLWFLIGLFTGGSWAPGILFGIIGVAVIAWFGQRDDELFAQYASEELRTLKQEKEKAAAHKDELKKYREACQGLQNDKPSGSNS